MSIRCLLKGLLEEIELDFECFEISLVFRICVVNGKLLDILIERLELMHLK